MRPDSSRRRVARSLLLLLSSVSLGAYGQTIVVDTSRPVHSLIPTQSLGAGIDRMPAAAIDKLFVPATIDKVLSAGWQTVSYRQNTELHVEAWHWNPQGTWSDPAGNGYFTGSTTPKEIIRHSHGYALPHRGVTRNEGTETVGYSRLTDGDTGTYWKSNPYLTKGFTHEEDALHPQWVVIDLANPLPVNAIRIMWGEPYARAYLVQFWTGVDDAIKQPTHGIWQTFAGGAVSNGKGGTVTLPLSASPAPVRFLRIWMTESSNTCDAHGSADPRNCVGYAIRELYLGTISKGGEFYDLVRHTPDQDQTATYCSSVDPWHQESDLELKNGDQLGLDLFYTSGFTRGLPAMVPVSMFYGTPEDAAAEIAYLANRKYPISYVELGEEPDGQDMLPEDYGALYLQWAAAIHHVDPSLKLGGPVFQGVNEDILAWPDERGRVSWMGRFLDYLRAHGRIADLAFMSFEHYPYEPCKIQWSSLYDEPMLVSHILQVWRDDGLPANVPAFITESNIAWSTGESFADIFAALWWADYVGAYLTAGGDAVYYFHYPPMGLHKGCNESVGTFGMFTVDKEYQIKQPIAQYFSSQLINLEWVQPGSGAHQIYAAAADLADAAGHSLVTAYALHRPDGQWSLLVINKDQWNSHKVQVVFRGGNSENSFVGAVTVKTFGSAQYQWHPGGLDGFADPDGPIASSTTSGSQFELPPASVTVVRGHVGVKSP